jgi:hypothetical protein
MTEGRRTAGASRVAAPARPSRRGGKALLFLLVVLSLFGLGAAHAHEVIDADQVKAALAAADAAITRVKSAAGSATEAEAKLALGLVQVETTDIINRDLSAHSGRLSFNGDSLQKALAQRDLSPAFDETIGRYRLPRTALEEALRLSLP